MSALISADLPAAQHRKVFVNGVEVPDCYAANNDEGWADHFVRDDDGLLATVKQDDVAVAIATERLYGEVHYATLRESAWWAP